jgi:hypothetical protein
MAIGMLAGCAPQQGGRTNLVPNLSDLAYETAGTFSTPKGDGALRRNRLTGAYDLVVDKQSIPVGAQGDVALVASQRVRDEQIVVLRGSTPTCAVAYGLYSFSRSSYSASPIGNCRDQLAFGNNGKQFLAAQVGANDPQYWVYGDHRTAGPILQSVLFAPPPQRQPSQAATRSAVAHAQPPQSASSPPRIQAKTDVAATPAPHVAIKLADQAVIPGEVRVPTELQHTVALVKLDD